MEGLQTQDRVASSATSYDNTLIARLEPRDQELLASGLEQVVLERDQVLAVPDATLRWAYFPGGTAMVALFASMADGRAAVTGTVGRDGATGLVEAVGDGISLSRAVVVLPGPALRITASKLAAAARRSPGLRAMLGRHGQEFAGQAMQLAACNALHPVRQRICRWILEAHDRLRDGAGAAVSEAMPLPLTQEMLGDALGVQRTTVTVVAMRLQQEGLVRYGRGRLFVLDRNGLEEAACECHRTLRQRRQRLLAEAVSP